MGHAADTQFTESLIHSIKYRRPQLNFSFSARKTPADEHSRHIGQWHYNYNYKEKFCIGNKFMIDDCLWRSILWLTKLAYQV